MAVHMQWLHETILLHIQMKHPLGLRTYLSREKDNNRRRLTTRNILEMCNSKASFIPRSGTRKSSEQLQGRGQIAYAINDDMNCSLTFCVAIGYFEVKSG